MEDIQSPPVTPKRVIIISSLSIILLLIVATVSLILGTAHIPFNKLLLLIKGRLGSNDPAYLIVFKIRLPRILLGGMTGYTLSLGGVVFQALLRNPLAEPFILGTSSGAALGAVIAIVLGMGYGVGVPLMAFGGAVFTLSLVIVFGKKGAGVESSTILLSGVIINAFFTAVIMFFIATSTHTLLHNMLYWLYGDLSQSRFEAINIIFIPLIIGSIVLYGLSTHYNLITAGEEEALHMGVEVEKVKIISIVVVSLMVGTVVSFSGIIGFVGLIVPHLSRMLVGSDHRVLIPVSAIGGAAFLIASDTLARLIISPSELPVGVVTAFLGAPFFIYLLRKRGSRWIES